ncbi:hypothetical protein ACFQJC_12685 [Haloferax namakaokahaiae]|uniref:DUF7310 domain-containing protein n=1 Tax=Haloferax namakaokahaiae TaxID=1748331 RepID=A0ABD5ZGL2_9EURY
MTDDLTHGSGPSPTAPRNQHSAQTETLSARLDAVERSLTGDDVAVSSLEDAAAVESRLSDLETAVEELSVRMDEVDAATQAMRGYLGGVRAVNEDVERRANAALAKAESLEGALIDESAHSIDGPTHAVGDDAISEAVDARTDADAPVHPDVGAEPNREDGAGLAERLRDVL